MGPRTIRIVSGCRVLSKTDANGTGGPCAQAPWLLCSMSTLTTTESRAPYQSASIIQPRSLYCLLVISSLRSSSINHPSNAFLELPEAGISDVFTSRARQPRHSFVPQLCQYTLHISMAAVSIPILPHAPSNMSTSRRVPLSSNPNAANSPYRAVAAASGQKQKRSYATIQREEAYGQPPPAKKQMLETSSFSLRTPPRQSSAQAAEGRVFTRRSTASQPTAFERKLEAARVRPAPQQVLQRAEKTSEENLEIIRQWQKHYRKVFPKYVFYFESVSEDVHAKLTRQITSLGAVCFFL